MVNAAAGFVSAVAATVLTQPTDGLRTRMQVSNVLIVPGLRYQAL